MTPEPLPLSRTDPAPLSEQLARLFASRIDAGLMAAVTGFSLINLALNPAMVITYDLIISSAPPDRAGTAAGTAETGNELGIALGVAIAGSIGAAVYRQGLAGDPLQDRGPPIR